MNRHTAFGATGRWGAISYVLLMTIDERSQRSLILRLLESMWNDESSLVAAGSENCRFFSCAAECAN